MKLQSKYNKNRMCLCEDVNQLQQWCECCNCKASHLSWSFCFARFWVSDISNSKQTIETSDLITHNWCVIFFLMCAFKWILCWLEWGFWPPSSKCQLANRQLELFIPEWICDLSNFSRRISRVQLGKSQAELGIFLERSYYSAHIPIMHL